MVKWFVSMMIVRIIVWSREVFWVINSIFCFLNWSVIMLLKSDRRKEGNCLVNVVMFNIIVELVFEKII